MRTFNSLYRDDQSMEFDLVVLEQIKRTFQILSEKGEKTENLA